jgi:hypothetical protein
MMSRMPSDDAFLRPTAIVDWRHPDVAAVAGEQLFPYAFPDPLPVVAAALSRYRRRTDLEANLPDADIVCDPPTGSGIEVVSFGVSPASTGTVR